MTPEQAFGLSPSRASAAQRQSPGPESKKPPEPETQLKSLTAKVVALRDRPYAGFVVTFDNGQVWMQYEDDSTRGVHVGDLVTIKPGVLGSFWLVGPSDGPRRSIASSNTASLLPHVSWFCRRSAHTAPG